MHASGVCSPEPEEPESSRGYELSYEAALGLALRREPTGPSTDAAHDHEAARSVWAPCVPSGGPTAAHPRRRRCRADAQEARAVGVFADEEVADDPRAVAKTLQTFCRASTYTAVPVCAWEVRQVQRLRRLVSPVAGMAAIQSSASNTTPSSARSQQAVAFRSSSQTCGQSWP